MREIKFRYVLKNIHTGVIHYKRYYLKQIQRNGLECLFDIANYKIISIEQFTGMKDKNNIDLYENDIVKLNGECYSKTLEYEGLDLYEIIGVIRFMPSRGFCLKFISRKDTETDEIVKITSPYGYITQSRTTKFGNIYTNPELLTSK